jgi:hypothetical protein
MKGVKLFLLIGGVLGVMTIMGCATVLPTIDPPKGVGWATTSQGYLAHEVAAGSDNSRHESIGLKNVALHQQKLSADDVQHQLKIGQKVANILFNEEMKKDYGL